MGPDPERDVASQRIKNPCRCIRAAALLALLGAALLPGLGVARASVLRFAPRSLNGYGENPQHPRWGMAGSPYQRLAPADYADGIAAMRGGPNPRYVSNRIFNSLGVDLFSARNVSQWTWVWGQFLDHTFGMAASGSADASIPFHASDPLESFRASAPSLALTRDAAAPGTGTSRANPRQQLNTVSSYIDAWAIYGGSTRRLDWLRTGADDGRSAPGADFLLPHGYLPAASARGDARTAPQMQIQGQLMLHPQDAAVSGDVRANENAELTAVHTLFEREHNRIVAELPRRLPAELRFQIARRVVGAEQQYITYTEFLPALGVRLARYTGWKPNVDPELFDEFATVGYRGHSMVNGEEHVLVAPRSYSAPALRRLGRMGVLVRSVRAAGRRKLELTIPQMAAFFNPALVPAVGLGPILEGLGDEPSYRNDEQIDDTLRSELFQFPGPTVSDPQACFSGTLEPGCLTGVMDLGAIDIQRDRDNGMPSYNGLRRALGLAPQPSFTAVTGERTDRFPASLHSREAIDDPHILDFTSLRDLCGHRISPAGASRAVFATRRTTLAARLRAIYGSVDRLDAFVGMVSEPPVRGTEFGPLQLALWRRQFEALRDGDRFFYLRDPVLREIRARYGITYRHTLAQLIELDAHVPASALRRDVFVAPPPARATPLPVPGRARPCWR
jgi:hypothetical protein